MTIKKYGMILKKDYVYKEDDGNLMHAIAAYEAKIYGKKVQADDFDRKTLPKVYVRDGEDKIYNDRLFAQLNSGVEYDRVYIIYNSKTESDWFRENAYPKNDRYAHKNIPERFADEYHIRDNRIQTPEKFGDVDGYLHWFVSKAPKIDVAHIDMNETPIKAYSVSDEYFAPVDHKEHSQEVEDWAIAFGLPRDITEELLELMPDEKDRYEYANGGMTPGSSPDAQVVKCPVCGRPTWAAPASVGFKNYTGEYVPTTEDSKQMTCEHCAADLSPCFNGEDLYLVDYLPTQKDFDDEADEDTDR